MPPYLGTYVRYAYAALQASGRFVDIRYLTIDDVRRALEAGDPERNRQGLCDPLTYSLTRNADCARELLGAADTVVAIAGDAVPSKHLQAVNGSLEELQEGESQLHLRTRLRPHSARQLQTHGTAIP